MNAMLKRLAALDPRVLATIVCAVGFLVLFEAWVVLRGPLAEMRALDASRARLQSVAARDAGTSADIERLKRELAALDKTLAGGLERSDDAMVPFLITSLDAIASRHGVSLGGVKPPTQRPLPPFEEVSFHVEARGGYRPLFDWLKEVLQAVDPLVATDFSIKSVDEGQRVALAVRLVGYRLPAAAVAAPGSAK